MVNVQQEEVTVKSEALKEENKKPSKKNKQAKLLDSAQRPTEPVQTVEEPVVSEKVASETSTTLPPVQDPVTTKETKEKKKKKSELNARPQLSQYLY